MINDIVRLKGANAGILFQNSEGDINMGTWFDDPDIEMNDIFWYNTLTVAMDSSLRKNEGLIYKSYFSRP